MLNNGNPLVSVIVPVFNGEKYLRESLDSILAQTYSPIEILVMDDCSEDGTEAVVASYGTDVQYHKQTQTRGIYDNVDDGIARARGEFIATYHADDVYDPAIVERQIEFVQKFPEVGAVFCLDVFIDAEGREYGRLELPPDIGLGVPLDYTAVMNALLRNKNTFLVCPSSLVRTSVYSELGGYRQDLFRNNADLDMWIRIARQCPIGIVDDYLMRYRHFHGSSSHRYHHLRTEPERHFEIMDHHLDRGGRDVAAPDALRAFEAHRSEDWLMIAIAHYISKELPDARSALGRVKSGLFLRCRRVQGVRLTVLYLLMQLLSRVPRIPALADMFYQRWHRKTQPVVAG